MRHTVSLATHIENALRQVLEHEADTLARETGFVQRQRTGSTFATLTVFGAASNPCPTYTDWTQAAALAGTTITPHAIEQRFTPQAARFLHAVLQRLAECVIPTCTPEVAPLLQRFAGVSIQDGTVITLPRERASVGQGLGDSRERERGGQGAGAVELQHGATGRTDLATCPLPRPHDAV